MKKSIYIVDAVKYGAHLLQKMQDVDAEYESQYILEELIGCSIIDYKLRIGDSLPNITMKQFIRRIEERLTGLPIAYIFKRKYFYKNYFHVSKSCLIPRGESELLVSAALSYTTQLTANTPIKILDICCGSGCLGLSFLTEYLNKNTAETLTLLDISKKALNIAQKNATSLSLQSYTKILQTNILSDMQKIDGIFDIIFYNPPYIKSNEILRYDKQLKHEPQIALDGGVDGLVFYKILPILISKLLSVNGCMLVEIGFDQKTEVEDILSQVLNIKHNCLKDLSSCDRCIQITRLS